MIWLYFFIGLSAGMLLGMVCSVFLAGYMFSKLLNSIIKFEGLWDGG